MIDWWDYGIFDNVSTYCTHIYIVVVQYVDRPTMQYVFEYYSRSKTGHHKPQFDKENSPTSSEMGRAHPTSRPLKDHVPSPAVAIEYES